MWNMLTFKYTDLVHTSHYNVAKKLKTSELFKAVKFNLLSASTAGFELGDFVYIYFNDALVAFQYAFKLHLIVCNIKLYLYFNLVLMCCTRP